MFANATSNQMAHIQEILQQLDRVLVDKDLINRRAADRVKIRSAMTVVLLSAAGLPSLTVFSRNISRSGLGFISRRPFGMGERVAVSFQVPGMPHKLVLVAVTFSRYVRAGVHEVGTQFLECVADTKGADRIPTHWLPNHSMTRRA